MEIGVTNLIRNNKGKDNIEELNAFMGITNVINSTMGISQVLEGSVGSTKSNRC